MPPETILYDAGPVCTLPVRRTVTSALDAIAHAAEGLYARPRVSGTPEDPTVRGETLSGAWLCGTVLGTIGMALHHQLCHTSGGSFDLPHADIHTVILPQAIAPNATIAAQERTPVADLCGAASPGLALQDVAARMRAPTTPRGTPTGIPDRFGSGAVAEKSAAVADRDVKCPLWVESRPSHWALPRHEPGQE